MKPKLVTVGGARPLATNAGIGSVPKRATQRPTGKAPVSRLAKGRVVGGSPDGDESGRKRNEAARSREPGELSVALPKRRRDANDRRLRVPDDPVVDPVVDSQQRAEPGAHRRHAQPV